VLEIMPGPSRRAGASTAGASFYALLFGVVIIACLYFAREVLVPIALAVLMSFVLTPVVDFLQRWHTPRALSVFFVVFIAFAGVFSLGGLMVSQVNQLAANLPRYQSTLTEKIQNLRGAAAGTGTLERASDVLQSLSHELDKPNVLAGPIKPPSNPERPLDRPATDRPIPVEVRQPDPGALQTLAALITPLISPLATTGIVVILVIFILIQRQDLRNRLVRLAGAGDLQRTTAAIDDAGKRLSRLFLTQLALNASFGAIIGVGLWIIGVPSAPLWGILAMILRFVPYIGSVVSAIFPLVLAAAVDPGWTMVLWTAAFFVSLELIAGQAIEPIVFGHSTGLSPVAVVASATFWTWLWGPIGLILATPLTICLVVLGRHVERLKFLDVMFGNQPALTPAELVYQRMLARDPVEAAEQAEQFMKDRPLLSYYEEILIEGLKLAQADADNGRLEEDRLLYLRDTVAEMVDDLSTHEDKPELVSIAPAGAEDTADTPLSHIHLAEKSLNKGARASSKKWQTGKPVLCIPGSGALDEAYTMIVAQAIERHNIGVRAETSDALSVSRVFHLETDGVELICLCYLFNATSAQIRYAVRRLRRKSPDAAMLVTLAGTLGGTDSSSSFQPDAGVTLVQGSLQEAVNTALSIADARAELEQLSSHPAAPLKMPS
jgi:predicted PurR-regulated permease PerM